MRQRDSQARLVLELVCDRAAEMEHEHAAEALAVCAAVAAGGGERSEPPRRDRAVEMDTPVADEAAVGVCQDAEQRSEVRELGAAADLHQAGRRRPEAALAGRFADHVEAAEAEH